MIKIANAEIFKTDSSVESPITACEAIFAYSFTRSSFISMAMTSSPSSLSALQILPPKRPRPMTAYSFSCSDSFYLTYHAFYYGLINESICERIFCGTLHLSKDLLLFNFTAVMTWRSNFIALLKN